MSSHSCLRSARRFAARVLRSAAIILLTTSESGSQQNLYTVEGIDLVVRDPSTGVERWSNTALYLNWLRGLAMRGGRLIGLDVTGWKPSNQTVRIHPADTSFQGFGNTGYKWQGFSGLDVDPTTGQVYVTYDTELYTLDESSGVLIHLGGLSGMVTGDCVCTLAIDGNGTAYGSGLLGAASLYQLDLATGEVTNLGEITPLSIGPGHFEALAFDSSGHLWGAYLGYFNNYSGLYKIDVSTLEAQLVVWGNLGIRGMAFGPATPEAVYCSPKTGSTGCVPTIRSTGVASPTASFGYDVNAVGVRNSIWGMLVYSTLGPANKPFGGGTLCVTSPWKRTTVLHSGGSPPSVQDCTGSWSYDMNTHFENKPGPAPGDTIWCQWLGRDPGFGPGQNYALSDALEFTLLP